MFIYILIIAVSIWVTYIMVYGKGGIVKRRENRREISLLKEELRHLTQQKEQLQWEIKNLSGDYRYIEGFAHDRGYRLDKEMIFKFVKRKNLQKPSK